VPANGVCQDPDHLYKGSYCGSWNEHRKIQRQTRDISEALALQHPGRLFVVRLLESFRLIVGWAVVGFVPWVIVAVGFLGADWGGVLLRLGAALAIFFLMAVFYSIAMSWANG